MDTKLKSDWIAALRSGKYEQCQKTLRSDDNKYCCIGVLCDVIDHKEWRRTFPHNKLYWRSPGNKCLLSIETLESINISVHQQDKLITLNDFEGKSFEEIADYIEQNI